jgi:poly(3-hydroxybutyrate) depolymerase
VLYQLREAQRAVLTPLSSWAEAMSQVYSNPYSPAAYTPFAPRMAAGFELLHRLGKEYEKPAWGLNTTQIDGEEVSVVERIELSRPFCRLIKFERLLPTRLKRRAPDPTVLLFAPLSGHHATLLRDTVRALLPNYEVYVTDWLDARTVPLSHGPFHLHDYVAYAMEFIRHLGPQVHLISVCQPTVPVLAAVSLLSTLKDPKLPRTMTMMGGPIDTRRSPTEVNNLATDKPFSWFERTVIYRVPGKYPGAGRSVYPGFLQHAGFVAMNPDRHAESHWDFYMQLVRGDDQDAESHRKFYDEYNAVLDMPAEYYLDTIRTVFQEHRLPTGTWVMPVEGREMQVNPADIRKVALLCIEGELDDISGIGQTSAALDLCTGLPATHKQYMVAKGAGHYGIFSGRRWREEVCPRIGSFIREHA